MTAPQGRRTPCFTRQLCQKIHLRTQVLEAPILWEFQWSETEHFRSGQDSWLSGPEPTLRLQHRGNVLFPRTWKSQVELASTRSSPEAPVTSGHLCLDFLSALLLSLHCGKMVSGSPNPIALYLTLSAEEKTVSPKGRS